MADKAADAPPAAAAATGNNASTPPSYAEAPANGAPAANHQHHNSGPFLEVPGSSGHDKIASADGAASTPSLSSDTKNNVNSTPKAADHDGEDPLRPDAGNEADFKRENNPFAFAPGHMGKMQNPKSLAAFKALGGLAGIVKGLRTDKLAGLSADEDRLTGNVSFQDAVHAETTDADIKQQLNKSDTMPAPSKTNTMGASNKSGQFADRIRIFGDNRLPEKKSRSLLELMWIAMKDKVLIILSIAACISLAVGLYQTFGQKHTNGEAKVDWVEGVAILVAVAIVVMVGAGNDWQKERQFMKLNAKKDDRMVKAIRSGRDIRISVFDVVVGDVLHLEPGDLIPVDGIFISGHGVKCDESSATGESDQMKKTPGDEVMKALVAGSADQKLDPFIISGSKVLEGVGTFVVVGVGQQSSFGKIMMALRHENEATPLQMKLNHLAEAIAKLGGAAALLLFVILFIRFLVELKTHPNRTAAEKVRNFTSIFIVAVTVVVVAVPEGLPLAVTLALAFATKRMLKDNNLVRVLQSCETMGNATTICTDKTGTLTTNRMTVVAGTIGTALKFADRRGDTTGDKESSGSESGEKEKTKALDYGDDDTVSSAEFATLLAPVVKQALLDSITLNSTAFEGETSADGHKEFIGSKTETALLKLATDHLDLHNVAQERANAKIVQMIPFDSGRKCMGVAVHLPDGTYRMFVKGASEILVERCSQIIADPRKSVDKVEVTELTDSHRKDIQDTISTYANKSLRTIGLIYRDFSSWPPKEGKPVDEDPTQADFGSVFGHMTFLGVVGIMDPLRPGVLEAIQACKEAGVFVRMVTGDNVITAQAIATECGIYTAGGLVMEGPKFRQLTQPQMEKIVPRLQVLARSSPEDKRVLVKCLKDLGETVAVTGDGTNDGPALKMADVGFSMGIAGTEVAKEASAIILMDDNFTSIVKAIAWGRAVNDAVKKFLQFQLTVNITAVLLTFVSAIASEDETSVLSAVQLLWVNLIMDTFAALALATDPPNAAMLKRAPDSKSAPLITINMWKMIIGQAIYQLVVTFILHFAGMNILGYSGDPERRQLKTTVFNTFVWMQIFNQYNNRRLDNKFNIFEGILRNYFFIGINVVMVGGQVLIIFIGGAAFGITRINGTQWAISLILGAISLPVAVIIRLIPDAFVAALIPKWLHRPRKHHKDSTYLSGDGRFQWNEGIETIRSELAFLKTVRGGRLNALSFKQHIKEHLPGSRRPSIPGTPSGDQPQSSTGSPVPSSRRRRSRSNSAFAAAAMVPSIVAGSIGGWSPVERGGHANFGGDIEAQRQSSADGARDAPSKDMGKIPQADPSHPASGEASALGVIMNPETKHEDPVFVSEPDSLEDNPKHLPPSQVAALRPDTGADTHLQGEGKDVKEEKKE